MARVLTSLSQRLALLSLLAGVLGACAAAQVVPPAPPTAAAQAAASQDAYGARRDTLRQKIGNGIVVLFGNTEPAGSEAFRSFRQESNLYYLTGYSSPGAVLLLAAGDGRHAGGEPLPEEVLFLPPRNPREEAWTGPQPDPRDPAVGGRLGIARVREMGALEEELARYGRSRTAVYSLLPDPHGGDAEQALRREQVERLKRMTGAGDVRDVKPLLAELRQIKNPVEVQFIRRAIECSQAGHRAAAGEVGPGKAEYEVAAIFKYTAEKMGCTITGFDPIVASGPRSVILHYTRGDGRMQDGDLVVVDAGGEYLDYSADITRTLPVSGRFTERQREIYEIVLGAQKAVLAAVRPGIRLYGQGNSLHQVAYDYLNSHGKDSQGEPLGKYFIHGVGHSVGLDVHDPMERAGVLRPGMVLAIEPGLYLPDENIGVRIEDMVLVTENGYELLTGDLPREVDAVEQWLRGE